MQPCARALQQARGCRQNVPVGPGGPGPGLACPSCPTPGGGGTYCGDCGLAPSGWRRRISRPSLSTPGAGTEPPSARRRCLAASPRVRPPPTRSPPRSRPHCCRRCDCRRHRCRHCALPASPAARMRFVTPRGLGCGWVGPQAGVAWGPAARAGCFGGCWGRAGRRGTVSGGAAASPFMKSRAAHRLFCWVCSAARRGAPWRFRVLCLAAVLVTQRGGGKVPPLPVAPAVTDGSAVASGGSDPIAIQIVRWWASSVLPHPTLLTNT